MTRLKAAAADCLVPMVIGMTGMRARGAASPALVVVATNRK